MLEILLIIDLHQQCRYKNLIHKIFSKNGSQMEANFLVRIAADIITCIPFNSYRPENSGIIKIVILGYA